MNQTQFEINLGQAEKEFSEIVGACFVWLRANTTKTELEILSGLQISLAEVIEEVKEKEARLN